MTVLHVVVGFCVGLLVVYYGLAYGLTFWEQQRIGLPLTFLACLIVDEVQRLGPLRVLTLVVNTTLIGVQVWTLWHDWRSNG